MRFSFTAEQEEFRAGLRRALETRSPTKEVRRLMATEAGFERESWNKLNQEMGLTAIQIPEAFGGQGFGYSELCIVLEEMGRAVLCAPYFSTAVLATNAILSAGSEEQKKALLPGIASGEVTATLAFAEGGGPVDAASIATVATRSGAAWRLEGTKTLVLDGHTADLIVVVARQPGTSGEQGLSFFTVEGSAPGLDRQALKTMDETRKLARLGFRNVEARLLGSEGAAAAPFKKTMEQAYICLANEMCGAADMLRESALEYVKMRMQFGRSIASFQTTKNKAADMLIDVELAKSASYYAAAALDDAAAEGGYATIPALASLAKASAAEACLQTAIHAVQMHGGIGFTWDNDTHLWFKRAKSSEILFGDANHHRELMMQNWGAGV